MNIENEYKEFNDYWNETIKGNSWTTLERQACFMGWLEAKKRALNLYNVRKQSELLKAYESMLLNAGDLTQEIKDQDRNEFIEAFNCA